MLLFLHHTSKRFHENGLKKKKKGLSRFRIFENLQHTTCCTVSFQKQIFKTFKSLIQSNSNATSGLLVLDSAQQVTCRTRPSGSCGKLLAAPNLGRQALLAAETFSLLSVYLNYKFGLGLPSFYLFFSLFKSISNSRFRSLIGWIQAIKLRKREFDLNKLKNK